MLELAGIASAVADGHSGSYTGALDEGRTGRAEPSASGTSVQSGSSGISASAVTEVAGSDAVLDGSDHSQAEDDEFLLPELTSTTALPDGAAQDG
jgi:hypothetical protein